MRNFLFFLITIILLSACGTSNSPYIKNSDWKEEAPPSSLEKTHTIWLIGDSGELDNGVTKNNYTVDGMIGMVDPQDTNATIIFLGDNVYPYGLVPEGHPLREDSEIILQSQLEPLKKLQNKIFFIPGNHDWNKHRKGGRESILRQEAYIENFYPHKDIQFVPDNACGDPYIYEINKDLVVVFIDSQWWLHDWSKEKDINSGCDIQHRGDLLDRIEEIFIDHKNDQIVFAMHHPIKSNGPHGGKFPFTDHVFPLHHFGVWFPLPVIGSAYPIYRQVTGSKQDITNKFNQELVYGIRDIAKEWDVDCIFTTGHEHGLQYFEEQSLKYVGCGAGGKTNHIRKGGEALYSRSNRGFAKIDFYHSGEAWIEYFTVMGDGIKPTLEFRHQLYSPKPATLETETVYPKIQAKDTIIAANETLDAPDFIRFWLGEQYRDIWATPVKADIVDLQKKHGGLSPIKKGGGMSSNSLRLQHNSGKQYILRSIRKDYRKLVPEGYGDLKLLDIMKDQNAASHPFGALAIPELSKAAGIYYTQPQLVFLKHQNALGYFNELFPEELYLLEERPSGDWSDHPAFGNSDDIMSYTDLLEKLREKPHHLVDQQWVLKSRLFDMLIHDWDRHDDQWRWAQFDLEDKKIYRPIPRDRDQAFYKFVGVFPWLFSHSLMPKFKTMGDKIGDVKYLNYNAKHFDRYFLNQLDWTEWELVLKELESRLTDEVITTAFDNIPHEIDPQENQDIIDKLISRKKDLRKAALEYYKFLNKEVEITGTDEADIIRLDILNDKKARLELWAKDNERGEFKRYERVFDPSITNEIRIYGLRGNDHLTISGSTKSPIKIRFIGGADPDLIDNQSIQSILVYDNKDNGAEWSGNIKDKTSLDIGINDYDRDAFQYDTKNWAAVIGSTQDYGFFFGGKINWTRHGWRKVPYSSYQEIGFTIAPGIQNAFTLHYDGYFIDRIGKWDLNPALQVDFRKNENYFGLGNESLHPAREVAYNWVRMQSVYFHPDITYHFSDSHTLKAGPAFESHDVQLTPGRISEDEELGFTGEDLDRRYYTGLRTISQFDFIQGGVFPVNGFRWKAGINYLYEPSKSENIGLLDLSTTFYLQLFTIPKLVLGNRIGYNKAWGDLQFFQYPALGNQTNLRGFRNERFRGNSVFYHNLDARLHIIDWNNNWLPMEIGITGGYDYGRVWLDDEASDAWHSSQSVGMYMNILGIILVHPYYSFVENDEGDVFSLRLGFSF